jgi:hypothetical protein
MAPRRSTPSDTGEQYAEDPAKRPSDVAGARLWFLRGVVVACGGVLLAGALLPAFGGHLTTTGQLFVRAVPSLVGLALLQFARWLHRRRVDALPPRLTIVRGAGLFALPYLYPAVVAGWILAPTFWLGGTLRWATGTGRPGNGWLLAVDLVVVAVAVATTPLAVVQILSTWRGRPRPYVGLTPSGLVIGTMTATVRVDWDAFGKEVDHYGGGVVAFAVCDRSEIRVRGVVVNAGVFLPGRVMSELTVRAGWNTNPRAVAAAVAHSKHWGFRRDRLDTADAYRSVHHAVDMDRHLNPAHW